MLEAVVAGSASSGERSLLSVDPLARPHVPSAHFVLAFLPVPSHSSFCSCIKFTLPFQILHCDNTLCSSDESLHEQPPDVLHTGGQRFLQKHPKIAVNVSLLASV